MYIRPPTSPKCHHQSSFDDALFSVYTVFFIVTLTYCLLLVISICFQKTNILRMEAAAIFPHKLPIRLSLASCERICCVLCLLKAN